MGSWIAHELHLRTICCEPLSQLGGLGGVSGVISASVGEKQFPVTQNWKRLTRREPRRQRRHTAQSPEVSATVSFTQNAAVIGHPKCDPSAHRVPDNTDGQLAEKGGDPVQRPARISQGGLHGTIPATYRIPKPGNCDAPATGSNHAVTKWNHAHNSGVESSHWGEAVRLSAMQEQHNCLGPGTVADEMQVRCTLNRSQTRH